MLDFEIDIYTFLKFCLKYAICKSMFFFKMYLVCIQGTYGKDCQHICGSCINQTHCHYVNGKCFEGCGPGYLGDKCVDGNTKKLLFLTYQNHTYSLIKMNFLNKVAIFLVAGAN